jgi:pSer/pThr/pTyr-binding forkhead associated (FHA) protein
VGVDLVFLRRHDDPLATAVSLGEQTTIIGREPTCGIVVPDLSVSRRHAELSVLESTLRVQDLDSKNGTYVDDERVQICLVRCGQRIRFGNISFVVASRPLNSLTVDPELETQSVDEADASPSDDPTALPLSPAERRVFSLILKGMAEKQIALRLHISRHTVHNHIRRIYDALNVHSRPELLALYLPQRQSFE